MAQIKADHLTMRPKLYFLVGSTLLGVGFAATILIALFFTLVSSFHMRTHETFKYAWFGSSGLTPLLHTIPWIPIFITILAFMAGIYLLKQYDFSYRANYTALAISLTLGVIIAGTILDHLGTNQPLRRVPPLQPLYQQNFVNSNRLVGTIISLDTSTATIISPEGIEAIIVWDENTRMPFGGQFAIGEAIQAVGSWDGDKFIAKGIARRARRNQNVPPSTRLHPGFGHPPPAK